MDEAIVKMLLNAGVGAALAALILFGLYRLLSKFVDKFIEAQTRQSEAIEGLSINIKAFLDRDSNEHREILILLKIINDKVGALERRPENE